MLDLPNVSVPQLINVYLEGESYSEIRSENYNFFALNPQIEVLQLRVLCFNGAIDYNEILKHLPNIKVLALYDSELGNEIERGFACIVRLKKLKTLRLSVGLCPEREIFSAHLLFDALREANIQLEHISITFSGPTNQSTLIDSICQFESIKSLKFNDDLFGLPVTGEHLRRFSLDLEQLECIHETNLHSLDGIHCTLKTAKRLEKAHFIVGLSVEDASTVFDTQLAAIDDISRQRGIELRIKINIGIDRRVRHVYVGEVRIRVSDEQRIFEELGRQFGMSRSWLTFYVLPDPFYAY